MKWLRNHVWIEKFENNLKKVNKSIERIENGMYDSIKRRKNGIYYFEDKSTARPDDTKQKQIYEQLQQLVQ
jgi:predicted DNA-binding protein YlxM (UPF0122 family)